MTSAKASSIRNWIKTMGFTLSGSSALNSSSKTIKYYILDNFGIYEETPIRKTDGKDSVSGRRKKFLSWTPWGDIFEVKSVKDISKAYADFVDYNPNAVAV